MNDINDCFLRLPEVKRICGLSRSSIWRLQQLGIFPKSYKISARAAGWSLNEVSDWLEKTKNQKNKKSEIAEEIC